MQTIPLHTKNVIIMCHYLKATVILQFLGLLPCSVYSKTTLWLLPSADYYFSSLKVTPRLIADWHTDYSHSFSDTQTTPIHTQTLRLLPFSHRLLPFSFWYSDYSHSHTYFSHSHTDYSHSHSDTQTTFILTHTHRLLSHMLLQIFVNLNL